MDKIKLQVPFGAVYFRKSNPPRQESSGVEVVEQSLFRLGLPQKRVRIQQKRSDSEADSDDSDASTDETGEAETRDEPPEPPRRRPRAQSGLHKGNTERYVMTVAKYSPAVAIPRTTSSKRKEPMSRRSAQRCRGASR